MEIKKLSKSDIKRKKDTRLLYDSCFTSDCKELVDYYYDVLIQRNEIFVIEDNDEIISMIHLNPYLYNICGEIMQVHYLFAIATRSEYRHKGYMMQLLNATTQYLKSLNEPFCYLMPEEPLCEKIYNKFGFNRLCNFTYDKFSKDEFDIFPVRNDEFNNLMLKEQFFLINDSIEYSEHLKRQIVLVKLLNDKYDFEYLKEKKVCFCNEM